MADLRITGGSVTLPTASVKDEQVATDAALDADKMQHVYKPFTNFDLAIGATPVAREEIVFVASGAGTIRSFSALLNDTGTSTNVSFDLKKNGTTMLSSAINVTNSDGDGDVKSATLSVTTFVADDIISIELTVTSSTGAQGPFAWVDIEEDSAP